MPEPNKSRLRFLLRNKTIIIVFLLAKTIDTVITGMTLNSVEAWGIGILAILIYSVLAWFSYTRQVISTWALAIVMLFEGIGPLSDSLKNLATTPVHAPVSDLLTLAISGYIVGGALIIFQSRHKCR
jgi:hypothetical protein